MPTPTPKAAKPAKTAKTANTAQPRETSELPRSLMVAAVATGIEAAALAASAVGLPIYQLAGHRPHDALDSWLVVAMAAIGAIALTFVSVGLWRGRRWARSPAVLIELIAVPVGISAIGNGAPWFGIPCLIVGLAGLVGLFAPSTTRLFSER